MFELILVQGDARGRSSAKAVLCAAAAFALTAACSDPQGDGEPPDAGAQPGDCPVSAQAQDLLLEAFLRLSADAETIVGQTHARERGFSRALIGARQAHTGFVTMVVDCTGPEEFVATCDSCGASCPASQTCFQLGCESADVATLRAWWQPVPRSYVSEFPLIPAFEIAYGAEPTLDVRYAISGEAVAVTWQVDDEVSATLDGNASVLDSVVSGSGMVSAKEDAPIRYAFTASYPTLGRAAIELAYESNGGVATGTVKADSAVVGTWVAPDASSPPRIAWTGTCSD